MLFNEYQELAWNTVNHDVDIVDNCIYGIHGESGELVDLLKKIIFHKHPVDAEIRAKIRKEAGDVIWYCAVLAKKYMAGAKFADCWKNDPAEMLFEGFADIDTWYATNMDSLPPMSYEALANKLGKAVIMVSAQVCVTASLKHPQPVTLHAIHSLVDSVGGVLACFDMKLDDAARENIEKLRTRYGEKFSTEASINRKD